MRRLVLLVAVIGLLVGTTGCGGDDGDGDLATASTLAPGTIPGALGTLIDTRILPTHQAFSDAATDLAQSVDPCPTDPEAVQEAWHAARLAWDAASVYRVGPQFDARLNAAVDYWPIDGDGIDAAVEGNAEFTQAQVDALGSRLRGLTGIEHVIFGSAPLDARRCAYVHGVSVAMAAATDEVIAGFEAWAPGYVDTSDAIVTMLSALAESVYRIADLQLGMPAGSYGGQTHPPDPSLVHGGDGVMASRDIEVALEEIDQALAVGIQPVVAARFAERPDPLAAVMDQARDSVAKLGPDLRSDVVDATPVVVGAAERCRSLRAGFATNLAAVLGVQLIIPVGDGD